MIPASMHLGQRHHDRATELEDRVKEGIVKRWLGTGSWHQRLGVVVSSSQSHENNGRRFFWVPRLKKDEAKQSKMHPICPFSPMISGLRFLGLWAGVQEHSRLLELARTREAFAYGKSLTQIGTHAAHVQQHLDCGQLHCFGVELIQLDHVIEVSRPSTSFEGQHKSAQLGGLVSFRQLWKKKSKKLRPWQRMINHRERNERLTKQTNKQANKQTNKGI